MWKGVSKYFALWFFLGGVVFIVFIQFISVKNNDRLVQGNKRLLAQVKIQNELRILESDLLTVESDIRGAVITDNAAFLQNISQKIANIKSNLTHLKTQWSDSLTNTEVMLLERLIQDKLDFSQQILTAYNEGGSADAERLINTGRGEHLKDSLIHVINSIDNVRQSSIGKNFREH